MSISLATRGVIAPIEVVSSGLGEILDITEGPITRWTPIVAVVQLTSGGIYIRYVSETLKFLIYDPDDGFVNNFSQRSSVSVDGDIYTLTILPNGGWWTNGFDLKFIAGAEVT